MEPRIVLSVVVVLYKRFLDGVCSLVFMTRVMFRALTLITFGSIIFGVSIRLVHTVASVFNLLELDWFLR